MISIADNSFYPKEGDEISEKEKERFFESLSPFAGKTLAKVAEENPQLLVFPHSFGVNEDGINESVLFERIGTQIKTGNVAGFIGLGKKVHVSIHSRFDTAEDQYFLHYMLQRVAGVNVVNLPTITNTNSAFDFLPYLFPRVFLTALQQGLYRTYKQFFYNDDRVRGAINVERHIRLNIPFRGNIAYITRERTTNNSLMHLIRHTIEFMRENGKLSSMLESSKDLREGISQIEQTTPDYAKGMRQKIISQNLRLVNHPYFTEWAGLQKLCLQILHHEKLSYGDGRQEIYGIIFDVAWLWEEYLATLLPEYEHPQNKIGFGKHFLYTDDSGAIYPDFIAKEERGVVLDAKYKKLAEQGDDEIRTTREDRFQLISYMHVMNVPIGVFLCPTLKGKTKYGMDGELNGLGGRIGVLPLKIPQGKVRFEDFCEAIRQEEQEFRRELVAEIEHSN